MLINGMIPLSIEPQTRLVYALIILMLSCSPHKKDDRLINELQKNLSNSIKSIDMSTHMWMERLREKIQDPSTKDRAEYWFAKADSVNEITKVLFDFIEKVKVHGFSVDKPVNQLVKRILGYRNQIKELDARINEISKDTLDYDNVSVSFLQGDSASLTRSINNANSENRLNENLILLQAKIKLDQNKIVWYSALKADYIRHDFPTFSAIIGQNSTHIMPGGELEIKAGIGAFSRASMPTILVNRQKYEINENGYVHYKVKAPTKPGSYTIPVLIKYFDQNYGKDIERSVNVEYTVMKKCKE